MSWIDMVSSTWHGKRMQLRQLKHFIIPTSKERRSTWNSQPGSHAEVEEDAEMTEEVDQWEVVGEDETVVETLVLDHTMIEEVGIVCTSLSVNSDKTIFSFNFPQVYIYMPYVNIYILSHFFISGVSIIFFYLPHINKFQKIEFPSLNQFVNSCEWCNILY